MNPLTLVKRIQNINSREAALGISEDASWHAKYKDSAYVFVGGIPFDLTEGDLLAVFAQYGEIVDVNLVRDKGTGKSKGFAFIAYEDQRSTTLAVDNLNGAQILGRVIRVDHVGKYKKKEEEDEEEAQRRREERGVCRAFQRGECTRGAGCKFSHDEQRAANTGWGDIDAKRSRWGHDKFEGSKGSEKRVPDADSGFRAKQKEINDGKERRSGRYNHEDERRRVSDRDERGVRKLDGDQHEHRSRNHDGRGEKGMRHGPPGDNDVEPMTRHRDRRDEKSLAGNDDRRDEKRSRRQGEYDYERKTSGGRDRMEERSRRSESDYAREDRHRKAEENRSYERGLTSRDHRGRDDRRVSNR